MKRLILSLALAAALLAPPALVRADAKADMEAAKAAAQKGKRDDAIRLLTKAINAKELDSPELSLAYYNRGTLYLESNKFDVAMADFTKAIEERPDFGNAYHNRGLVKAQMKRWEEAEDDLSRALSLLPTNAFAFFNRAKIYEQLNRKDAALKDYQAAYRFDPRMKQAQDAIKRLSAK